jgi:very-short-patch-repair endonuclease
MARAVEPRTQGTGVFEHPAHAPGAVKRARRFRKEAPVTERMLWDALRRLKLNVRRQAPLGRYVADFIHHGAKLVIEIDSGWHDLPERQLLDAERDAWCAGQGYAVLRIKDGDVFHELDAAVQLIQREITQRSLPPQWGEGGVGGVSAPSTDCALAAPTLDLSSDVVPTPPSPTLPPSRGKGARGAQS